MASEREKIIGEFKAKYLEHLIQAAEVGTDLGWKRSAIRDHLRRASDVFKDEPFTEQTAQAWGKQERLYEAPHRYAAALPPAGTPAPLPPGSQGQTRDYNAISNPADRLTQWRTDEQAKAQAGRQP